MNTFIDFLLEDSMLGKMVCIDKPNIILKRIIDDIKNPTHFRGNSCHARTTRGIKNLLVKTEDGYDSKYKSYKIMLLGVKNKDMVTHSIITNDKNKIILDSNDIENSMIKHNKYYINDKPKLDVVSIISVQKIISFL